jgi:hypothetical protein
MKVVVDFDFRLEDSKSMTSGKCIILSGRSKVECWSKIRRTRMTQSIRLEIDLALDQDGNIQGEATNLKEWSSGGGGHDGTQTICFLTGQSKGDCQCSECTTWKDGERMARASSGAVAVDRPEKQKDIEVVFTHVWDASTFTAFVNPVCTGEQALDGLIAGDEKGPFLEPAPAGRPYELAVRRSGAPILRKMTFAAAGVIDGDKIEVRQGGQGAGAAWDAIQLSLAYGVGTGAGLAFIRALAPILLQIVKNQGSQSVEIQVGGKRIKIVGRNSFKKVEAAIKQLAELYGMNESSESKEPRNLRSKNDAPTLKSRETKAKKLGTLSSERTRSRRFGKATKNRTLGSKRRKEKS